MSVVIAFSPLDHRGDPTLPGAFVFEMTGERIEAAAPKKAATTHAKKSCVRSAS
jgi:hypothetical protein